MAAEDAALTLCRRWLAFGVRGLEHESRTRPCCGRALSSSGALAFALRAEKPARSGSPRGLRRLAGAAGKRCARKRRGDQDGIAHTASSRGPAGAPHALRQGLSLAGAGDHSMLYLHTDVPPLDAH